MITLNRKIGKKYRMKFYYLLKKIMIYKKIKIGHIFSRNCIIDEFPIRF